MLKAEVQGNEEYFLVERAAVNPGDFLALYDRYFPRVYTYFRYRFNDPALCDDLCAQTFLQALEHIEQFSPKRGPWIGWLFGIARNLANKQLRKSRRFPLLSLDALWFVPGSEASPEEQTVELEEQSMLQPCFFQNNRRLCIKFSEELPTPIAH